MIPYMTESKTDAMRINTIKQRKIGFERLVTLKTCKLKKL